MNNNNLPTLLEKECSTRNFVDQQSHVDIITACRQITTTAETRMVMLTAQG